jgi:hypothetical protein
MGDLLSPGITGYDPIRPSAAGQIDVKHGAATRRVLESHRPAQPRDYLLDDAQSKPGSTLVPRVRGVGLREFVEYMRLEVGRNAGAMIAPKMQQANVFCADRARSPGIRPPVFRMSPLHTPGKRSRQRRVRQPQVAAWSSSLVAKQLLGFRRRGT